jgi:hypothetical protein
MSDHRLDLLLAIPEKTVGVERNEHPPPPREAAARTRADVGAARTRRTMIIPPRENGSSTNRLAGGSGHSAYLQGPSGRATERPVGVLFQESPPDPTHGIASLLATCCDKDVYGIALILP